MSDDSARRFMNVAEVYGDKIRTVRNLTPTVLYELAARRALRASLARGQRHGITAVQKFDSNGVIGVWLFLLGPIVSGLCIAWAVNDRPLFGNLPMAPYIIMALSGLAFLVGCVCMLIGRYQEITVRSLEP